ncbi:PsbP-related protein [Numidum massiliense]|uniref:PsbP-related protein n=1 Tax=Numidum massiliense TaxID=1522315 RepID=UPI0006D52AFA|nr:PsbP-related protein [Numidum massiliense]
MHVQRNKLGQLLLAVACAFALLVGCSSAKSESAGDKESTTEASDKKKKTAKEPTANEKDDNNGKEDTDEDEKTDKDKSDDGPSQTTLASEQENVRKSPDGSFQIEAPKDWRERNDLNPQATLGLANLIKEKYLIILYDNKKDFVKGAKLDDYYDIVSTNMTDGAKDGKASKPQKLTINELPALHFSMPANVEGIDVQYIVYLVEADDKFYQLVFWTVDENVATHQAEFEKIAASFRPLAGDAGNATSTTKEAPKGEHVVKDEKNKVQLTVPGGWESTDDLNDSADIQVQNLQGDEYAIVIFDEKKENELVLDDFVDFFHEMTADSIDNLKTTSPKKITIGNYKALQFEATGEMSKYKIAYLYTVVETKTHFYQIMAWSNQDQFAESKKTFQRMVNSFKDLK